MRELDITKQDIRCCDDLCVDTDTIDAMYELWFDVDKYFGINLDKNGNEWINFYTYYHPDGNITAIYEIDTDDNIYTYDWELTQKEKEFFKNKMEKYCMKLYKCSLDELFYKEYQD